MSHAPTDKIPAFVLAQKSREFYLWVWANSPNREEAKRNRGCMAERKPKMQITMLKGKIHRATVTQAELDYVGSITVDEDLLDAAGIMEYEKVQIVDIDNGNRFLRHTRLPENGEAA